jgi:DNA mismatch endonuclease (patch repair protein)
MKTLRPKATDEATAARMRAVRVKGTAPELTVRRLLWSMNYRYRVCPRNLPGKPDIANRSNGWCLFVHGCFWHGHGECNLGRLPRSNRDWWASKIDENRKRDAKKEAALKAQGLRVLVVWQCELANLTALEARLREFIENK